jgi:hypothetical protein
MELYRRASNTKQIGVLLWKNTTQTYLYIYEYLNLHCNLKIFMFNVSLERIFKVIRGKYAMGLVT